MDGVQEVKLYLHAPACDLQSRYKICKFCYREACCFTGVAVELFKLNFLLGLHILDQVHRKVMFFYEPLDAFRPNKLRVFTHSPITCDSMKLRF